MKIIWAVLILSLAAGCLDYQADRNNQSADEELQIYKTLLANRSKEAVVVDETMVGVFGEIETGGLKEILKGLQDDTLKSLAERNSNSADIVFGSSSNFDYQIISRKEFAEDAENLYRYYAFSRVGFSDDGKQAVVIFIEGCQPLFSKGAYYLLSKKNGVWEIKEESESWHT